MANLRVLATNVGDTATVTATTTAGTLVATNVQTDLKSQVWRSTSTTDSITNTWTTAQSINMVAIPYCNLSATATIQISAYTNAGDSTPVYTTGIVAFPGNGTGSGVNNYAYGGGANAVFYFPASVSVKQVILSFVDTSNALGYIEVGRVCMGSYYEAAMNAEFGTVISTLTETTTTERSDAGDLRVDVGTMFKTLSFQLPYMESTDRDYVWKLLRSNGMRLGMFVDIVPASTDGLEESIYSIYGKLSKNCALTYQVYAHSAVTIEIVEI